MEIIYPPISLSIYPKTLVKCYSNIAVKVFRPLPLENGRWRLHEHETLNFLLFFYLLPYSSSFSFFFLLPSCLPSFLPSLPSPSLRQLSTPARLGSNTTAIACHGSQKPCCSSEWQQASTAVEGKAVAMARVRQRLR